MANLRWNNIVSNFSVPLFIKILLSRSLIVFFVLFIILNKIVDYDRIKFGYKIKIIERLMPDSFIYLLEAVEARGEGDPKLIVPYIPFYAQVASYFPERIDAFNMLGFCYYYRGEVDKAIAAYKEAIKKDPAYFWSYYNLGVIYFKNGEYEEAIYYLREALARDKEYTLKYILDSKVIYKGILLEASQNQRNLHNRFLLGYRNAYILLCISMHRIAWDRQMMDVAIEAINKNLETDGTFVYLGGFAAYQFGNYMGAILYFQKAVELNPKIKDAYYYWGKSLAQLGKKEIAQSYYEKAARLNQIDFIEEKAKTIHLRLF